MVAYINERSLYQWIKDEIDKITSSEKYSTDKVATLNSVLSHMNYMPKIRIEMENVTNEDVHLYI